ncbi:MAG: hypothetical protein COA78_34225 [Blastopirellula sp.]|nr:MAG: hypothetical protein COA78_34225 [Blastopirellula sp.]
MNKALRTIYTAACFLMMAIPTHAQTKITIGGGPYLDVPQISVAMDKNLWAGEGLEANIVAFRSGRDAFEALLGGQLDFALMAEFPAVIGAMRDQKFSIIAEMSQYTATRIIHTGDDSVKTVADLAGKPIGTTTGTNVHFMLENELALAGVKAEIVSVGPPDIVAALSRGDIFGAAMFPSFYAGAKKTLGDRYKEISVSSYGTHFILVATANMINDNPDVVSGVLRALYNGEKVVTSDPTESHAAVSRVISGTLKPDEVAAASKNYSFRMGLDNDLVKLMVQEGEWIHARGSIKGDKPTVVLMRGFVAGQFLSGIDASRVNLD